MCDQYEKLRQTPLTVADIEEAQKLIVQVISEREIRHSGFLGVPPRPGSWIPRDPVDDLDDEDDQRHATRFGGLRERP